MPRAEGRSARGAEKNAGAVARPGAPGGSAARGTVLPALRAAFPHTVPILAGFLFLGTAYGIYMNAAGFGFVYPMVMAVLIFGGSLEFIAASLLLAPFDPVGALLVSLMVQARHLFYGIAMLDRYRGLGWKRPYLIFGLCDETFSINYSAEVPEGVDRGWFMFFVTLLNQLYWVCGATLGGLLGELVPFETEGLSFVMTALFVVIFIDQWEKDPEHRWSGVVGGACAAACLAVFGADGFMAPTMVCIVLALLGAREVRARRTAGGAAAEDGRASAGDEAAADADGAGDAS